TVPVPHDQLPVLLPDHVQFTGTGGSPLAGAAKWVHVTCPQCGGPAERETDTMDTFVDSSWYYYRFTSPHADAPFDRQQANRWMPVDEYVGGKEHAVLHLLYSRFFTKVLHDAGRIDVDEPFARLLSQGMVVYHGAKMSKSKGNTLSPEQIMQEWGSDATRIFMLFAAPPEKDFEWSEQGVEGAYRFLQRVYRLVLRPAGSQGSPEAEQRIKRERARAIKKVTEDIKERRAFNTAISTLMELTNALYADSDQIGAEVWREGIESLVLLLAPFAPHLTEELWHVLGHTGSVHQASWPSYLEQQLQATEVEVAVQVNGKVRVRLVVPAGLPAEELGKMALDDPRIAEITQGKRIVKVVPIVDRLVNVVMA
ncbi:MAG: class I tRNA ligase family protein, partial [Firmicutes bacterium]|nr:class I tRNA ligase family protein [Bacillota bacterium]